MITKHRFLVMVLMLLLGSAFTVQADDSFNVPRLDVPVLLEPVDNEIFNHPEDFVEFEWSFVLNATKYRIIVRDQTLGTTVFRKTVNYGSSCLDSCGYIPTLEELSFLKHNHVYSWKVLAISPTERARSSASQFSAAISATIELNSPDDGLIYGTPDEIVGFTWSYTGKLDKFRLVIKNTATGANIISVPVQVGTLDCGAFFCAYYLSEAEQALFGKNKTYKWRVKGINPLGRIKSENRTFHTMFSG